MQQGYAARLLRTLQEADVALSEYPAVAEASGPRGRFLDAGYHRQRLPSSLGYRTPEEFERPWRADPAARPVVP